LNIYVDINKIIFSFFYYYLKNYFFVSSHFQLVFIRVICYNIFDQERNKCK